MTHGSMPEVTGGNLSKARLVNSQSLIGFLTEAGVTPNFTKPFITCIEA